MAWLPSRPHDDCVQKPQGQQSFPVERWTFAKDQIPQLPQSTPAVGYKVAIEDVLSVNNCQGVSPDIDLSRLVLLVDDVSQLSEALFFLKEEKGLNFQAIRGLFKTFS